MLFYLLVLFGRKRARFQDDFARHTDDTDVVKRGGELDQFDFVVRHAESARQHRRELGNPLSVSTVLEQNLVRPDQVLKGVQTTCRPLDILVRQNREWIVGLRVPTPHGWYHRRGCLTGFLSESIEA